MLLKLRVLIALKLSNTKTDGEICNYINTCYKCEQLYAHTHTHTNTGVYRYLATI